MSKINVTFKGDYLYHQDINTTIAYKKGMRLDVDQACYERALALGLVDLVMTQQPVSLETENGNASAQGGAIESSAEV